MDTSRQSKLLLAVTVILGVCTSGSAVYAGQQSPLDPYSIQTPVTKAAPVLPNNPAVVEPSTTYVTIPMNNSDGEPSFVKDLNTGLKSKFNFMGGKTANKAPKVKPEKVKPEKVAIAPEAKPEKPPKAEKPPKQKKETKIGKEIKLKSDKHKNSIASGAKIDKSIQASSPSTASKPAEQEKDSAKVADNQGKLAGAKDAGNKLVDGSKAASSKFVSGSKVAGTKLVDGSKSLGEDMASGTKKVGTSIKSGAKASGEFFVKGAKAIGGGFKGTGEKLKEGTDGLGDKMSAVPHLFGKDKDKKSAPTNVDSLAKSEAKSEAKNDAAKAFKPEKSDKRQKAQAQAPAAQYMAGGKPVKLKASNDGEKKGLMSKTLGAIPFFGSKKEKVAPAPSIAASGAKPGTADLSQARPVPLNSLSPVNVPVSDPARATASSSPTNSL